MDKRSNPFWPPGAERAERATLNAMVAALVVAATAIAMAGLGGLVMAGAWGIIELAGIIL